MLSIKMLRLRLNRHALSAQEDRPRLLYQCRRMLMKLWELLVKVECEVTMKHRTSGSSDETAAFIKAGYAYRSSQNLRTVRIITIRESHELTDFPRRSRATADAANAAR